MSAKPEATAIGTGWHRYRLDVLPANAHAMQLQECRRAFYAGAVFLFGVLLANADLSEDEAMRVLDSVRRELERFPVDVAEGRA